MAREGTAQGDAGSGSGMKANSIPSPDPSRPARSGWRGRGPRKAMQGCARVQKKAPQEVYLVGGVNPAATYSPGSEDQVPSAI